MDPARIKLIISEVFLARVLFPALLFLFLADQFFVLELQTGIIVLILAVAGVSIMVLRYKQLLLFSLSFLVPLSVQLPVIGTARVSVPAEMIAVLLSVFFFVKVVCGHQLPEKFTKHPLTVLILMDIAWLFITSCVSGMPEVSFKRFTIRLLYYITFYYFFYELFAQDGKNIKRMTLLCIGGMLVPIFYEAYRHAQIGFSMVGSQKLSAPFYFDHTIYGACLVFFLPFLIHQCLRPGQVKNRIVYSFVLLIFFAATWLSYSRAAWLSFLIAIAIYFIIHFKIKLKVVAGIVIFAGILFLLSPEKYLSVFTTNKEESHTNDVTRHLKSVSNISTDASNKERINRWNCALRMFADKPVFGFGPGTYQFFYGPYQLRSELTRISTFTGNKGHAHSEYLNYLSETGLPGLLIFLAVIFTVIRSSVKIIRTAARPWISETGLYLFCALISFFIHAFFNGFLEFDKVAMPVLSAFAAITFLDLKNRELGVKGG